MQSFSYHDQQHSPFLPHSVKDDAPRPFMQDGRSVDNNNNNHSFSHFYPTLDEISASGQNVAVLNMKQTADSSGNQVSSDKRKTPDSSSLYSVHEDKKLKKSPVKNEEKKGKSQEQKKDHDPPKGYIHVRARRGQATDSHSLAERVRREKISERMKLLQSLVPGCDKVTGKALMLDEIINYVQSLQNQVEFLSMKLASVNPMFYGYGFDVDAFLQCSSSHAAAFMDTTTNYPLVDPSTALLLQQGQRSTMFPQDNASDFWDVDDPRHKLYHHSGFSNNLCSYN